MAYIGVVTGCSGYIGTELVKQLLVKGWNVRGTVRSLQREENIAHLRLLAEALPGRLTLHEANLLEEGSFDEVVHGSDIVFHTASPFIRKVEDPQRDLLEPAVKGTTTVLKSAIRSMHSVRRVVLTSSMAAMIKRKKGPSNGELYTDEDWNDEATLAEASYAFSKTEAERAAWRLAREAGLDLVTIHPAFVLGPVLSRRTDGTSVADFKAPVGGQAFGAQAQEVLEGGDIGLTGRQVDVRDVAAAHVRAAEVPAAHGRYIVCSSGMCSAKLVGQVLSKRFPDYQFNASQDAWPIPDFDTSKARKELGMQFTPIETTYQDMAVTMLQLGMATPLSK